ncbi:putative MFS-type transporter YcnB [Oceanobacillus oncorhynchi subsp. incaldanensis]|uniref:DHA2 family efflux MFS transporter permease subunit n=1 Tax=Oceanobacillus aidingensis TaxID=645964 RepID=A0ABV9JWE9_9BACI|nr:DHA2 family efflux MFS transporter permease subunit [Oceanobacillus oncorhynchi]GIO18795.1 putative MFS-type transporter YcnB [Oceanobacillus oncorhynchi subsp. incaldanensis]
MQPKLENKGVIIVTLATGFLLTFCQFLLITSYPAIMREFQINATEVQWLTTIYLLTTIVFIPLTGYLSNRFSTKALLVFALLCMAAGLIVGAFSQSFIQLILARAIQAVGTGVILPVIQTILITVFPKERRGFALGLLGGVINVAPASAPSLTGMIIDVFHWRILHWFMLPLVLILLLLAVFYMKDVLKKQAARLDILSVILSAGAFSLFIISISNISVAGMDLYLVILPFCISAVFLYLFIQRQLADDVPVLNVRLFQNRTFLLAVVLIFMDMMLLLSAETILPMFAQNVLETSAFLSGFLLVPGTILLCIVSVISGNLYDRYGGRILAVIGFAFTLVSLVLMTMLSIDSSPFLIMIYFCFFMTGFGLSLMPLVSVSVNVLDEKEMAHNSAIVNTVRQLGMAFGVVILTTVISVTTAVMDAPERTGTYWGTTYAFMMMAVTALLGVLLSMRIKEKIE